MDLFFFQPVDEDGKADLEAQDFQCIQPSKKNVMENKLNSTESYL